MRSSRPLLGLAFAAAAGLAHAEPTPAPNVLAPGWTALGYAAPTPGTYELPPLGEAANGDVLDTTGRARHLYDFLGDKVVVLSFVYRSCPDINGCPLANFVLKGVERRVLEDPALRDEVRLVSMSFDPANDTPDAMRRLRRRPHAGRSRLGLPHHRIGTVAQSDLAKPTASPCAASMTRTVSRSARSPTFSASI